MSLGCRTEQQLAVFLDVQCGWWSPRRTEVLRPIMFHGLLDTLGLNKIQCRRLVAKGKNPITALTEVKIPFR